MSHLLFPPFCFRQGEYTAVTVNEVVGHRKLQKLTVGNRTKKNSLGDTEDAHVTSTPKAHTKATLGILYL